MRKPLIIPEKPYAGMSLGEWFLAQVTVVHPATTPVSYEFIEVELEQGTVNPAYVVKTGGQFAGPLNLGIPILGTFVVNDYALVRAGPGVGNNLWEMLPLPTVVADKRVVTNVCPEFETIYGTRTLSGIKVEWTNPDGSKECETNPTDCCPVISGCTVCDGASIASSLTLSLITNGCATGLCPDPASGIVGQDKLVYGANPCGKGPGWKTAGIAVCVSPPGTTACVYVNACMYCLAGVFVIDVTRTVIHADCTVGASATHTALAVTVSACDPFCATFTVLADAACATDTVYRISADPDADCGSLTCDRTRTALGTDSTSGLVAFGGTIELTIPDITVQGGSFIEVQALVAALASITDDPQVFSVSFAGVRLDEYDPSIGLGFVALYTSIWIGNVVSTTTGDVVIAADVNQAFGVTAFAALLGLITSYTGAHCFDNRWGNVDQNDVSSAPHTISQATGASATAPEALAVALAMYDTIPPVPGTPGGGFVVGQSVSLSPAELSGTVELRELYQIITANGTYQASTSEAHDAWASTGTGA